MFKGLGSLGRRLLGESGARMLAGAGISVASYAALAAALTAALSGATSTFSGVPSIAANLMMMCGVGEALSIIGAAMMTKAAMQSSALGLTKTAA